MQTWKGGRKVKIDYCRLTEDLMPLYDDELVSKETKDFIEWHLEQCPECRKKYRDKDSQIPDIRKEIIYPELLNIEEEDKFRSAKTFLLKVRKRMFTAGIVVLIIMLIASAGSFFYGKSFNNEVPVKVNSAEDFANSLVPGWQRAQQSGQIVDINITKPIPDTEAVVTFEKVWYTPSYTYVLYTVTEPNKNYLMASQRVIDIPPEDYMRDNSTMEPLGKRWGGISPQGYHQIMVFMGYHTPVPAQELTLTVSNWIIPEGSMKPEPVDTIKGEISVNLPLQDEFLKESSERVTLDKSYEWEGRSLRLTGLEVKSSQTLLYGEAKLQEGETLSHLEGFIRSGGQSAGLSYESIVPGDAPNSFKFTLSAQPLNQWPGKVSLDIRAIQFKTSEVLNFPVDWSFYVSKEGQIDVTEEQVPAVAFYDGMVRLSSIDPTSWLELEIVEPSQNPLNKQPYIIMSPDPPFVERFNNYTTGLKITNENGEVLEVGSRGSFRDGGRMGVGFEMDSEDELWKTSKKITITINKPEAHLVVNQEIELN